MSGNKVIEEKKEKEDTWVVLPKKATVSHLTRTSTQKPALSCDSFKAQYIALTPPGSWPDLCVFCDKQTATLGAHVSVVSTEGAMPQTWYGLLPCCSSCNNNTKLRQKSYRLSVEEVRLACLTSTEVEALCEVHVRVTQGQPALLCTTPGCEKPVCLYNPKSCGGKSKMGCCEHYRARGKIIACSVRRGLKEATPAKPPPRGTKKVLEKDEMRKISQKMEENLKEMLGLLDSLGPLPADQSAVPPHKSIQKLRVRDETKGSSPAG